MMYWVYLYADTFIWQNNNEYLIYNTSNNNSIYGKCVGHLGSIISGLHDMRPLQNSLFKICSFHHIFVPL